MENLKRYIHTAIFYALMAMAGGVLCVSLILLLLRIRKCICAQ